MPSSPPVIREFRGAYRFLSNFHAAPIHKWRRTWLTAEHVYQASKSANADYRASIQHAPTPGQAKRLGSRVVLTDTWMRRRRRVMFDVVLRKFTQNPALGDALLATGDALLVEGNSWGDCFWGVCNGVGDNHLGRILMRVRDRLRRERGSNSNGPGDRRGLALAVEVRGGRRGSDTRLNTQLAGAGLGAILECAHSVQILHHFALEHQRTNADAVKQELATVRFTADLEHDRGLRVNR